MEGSELQGQELRGQHSGVRMAESGWWGHDGKVRISWPKYQVHFAFYKKSAKVNLSPSPISLVDNN
jgi:hypothetical protein